MTRSWCSWVSRRAKCLAICVDLEQNTKRDSQRVRKATCSSVVTGPEDVAWWSMKLLYVGLRESPTSNLRKIGATASQSKTSPVGFRPVMAAISKGVGRALYERSWSSFPRIGGQSATCHRIEGGHNGKSTKGYIYLFVSSGQFSLLLNDPSKRKT